MYSLRVESQWLLKRICAHVQYSLDFGNYMVFIEDFFRLFLRSRKVLNKYCSYIDMCIQLLLLNHNWEKSNQLLKNSDLNSNFL